MLDRARERVQSCANIRFHQASFADLSVLPEPLDVAVAVNSLVLPNPDDLETALREIVRRLKPDGYFLGILPAMDAVHYYTMLLIDRAVKMGKPIDVARKNAAHHCEHEYYDFAFGQFRYRGLDQHFWQPFEVHYRFRRAGFTIKRLKKIHLSWKQFAGGQELQNMPRRGIGSSWRDPSPFSARANPAIAQALNEDRKKNATQYPHAARRARPQPEEYRCRDSARSVDRGHRRQRRRKSSLVFDTLYAEAQRRYLQSFSTSTRQYLERFDKPDADAIGDLPPAVAIRRTPHGPRATVGSLTEIADHVRLLFARAGVLVCPTCGERVIAHRTADVITVLQALQTGTRATIAFLQRR